MRIRDERTAWGRGRNCVSPKVRVTVLNGGTLWCCYRATIGVVVTVSERFLDAIASVLTRHYRFITAEVYLFSVNAPQADCSEGVKDEFWSLLDHNTADVSDTPHCAFNVPHLNWDGEG